MSLLLQSIQSATSCSNIEELRALAAAWKRSGRHSSRYANATHSCMLWDIERCLAQLPVHLREAIHLRCELGLTDRERADDWEFVTARFKNDSTPPRNNCWSCSKRTRLIPPSTTSTRRPTDHEVRRWYVARRDDSSDTRHDP